MFLVGTFSPDVSLAGFCRQSDLYWGYMNTSDPSRGYWQESMVIGYFQDAVSSIPSLYTGRRQLPTAANSQYGGRRSRYKIVFAFHAIIKYPFPVLWVCIHRNSMYVFIEHCHLNYMSRLLLLDGGKGNGGLMVIYNSQKHRMMAIAPKVR